MSWAIGGKECEQRRVLGIEYTVSIKKVKHVGLSRQGGPAKLLCYVPSNVVLLQIVCFTILGGFTHLDPPVCGWLHPRSSYHSRVLFIELIIWQTRFILNSLLLKN